MCFGPNAPRISGSLPFQYGEHVGKLACGHSLASIAWKKIMALAFYARRETSWLVSSRRDWRERNRYCCARTHVAGTTAEPFITPTDARSARRICSRCKDRPAGGPPCAPLGKPCEVELYLSELIETIHEVQDELIEPYRQSKQRLACSRCVYLHSDACPCPMDYWFVPILNAVELVDLRGQRHTRAHQLVVGLPRQNQPNLVAVDRAYEEAAGTGTGCDWTTRFGNNDLDLNGWTAKEAESMAVESTDPDEVED